MGVNWSGSTEEYSEALDPFDHLNTVKDLDLNLISGTWWVMAHHANEWEEGCHRSTREVSYDSVNNKLNVVDKCWREGKLAWETEQVMSIPDINDKGKMKASVVQKDIEYRFWVHSTDYDNYVIVGDPKHHKAWIWTRQERVSEDTIPKFMNLVSDFGYNPEEMIVDSSDIIVT